MSTSPFHGVRGVATRLTTRAFSAARRARHENRNERKASLVIISVFIVEMGGSD